LCFGGGTWLGVTKTGKFAFLTNYLTPETHDVVKERGSSRGCIVKDYLCSNISISDYIQQYLVDKDFRPFTFIGGHLSSQNDPINMFYYSNLDKASPYKLESGPFTLTCTSLGKQWKKVNLGSDIFASALKNHDQNPIEFTDLLISDLLSNNEKLYPDPLVSEQNGAKLNDITLQSYCSIMITGLPTYGTRSQTVILVNKHNHMFFTENNRIKNDSGNVSWERSFYDFPLDL